MTGKALAVDRAATFSRSQTHQQPPATSVHQLLKRRAETRPDAIAIMAPGRRPLTYQRLLNQVEATVAALRTHRLRRNDRVAGGLPNVREMGAAFDGVAAG